MRRVVVLTVWVFLWGACSPSPTPTSPPTPTAIPTMTPSNTPSPTSTPLPTATPTITPSPTPTPGPYADIIASGSLAVTYKRADWEAQGDALVHRTFSECEMVFGMATELPMQPQNTRLFGYRFNTVSWQAEGKTHRLYIGPQGLYEWGIDPMAVRISAPAAQFQACEKAARQVLRTLHIRADQQEICPYAQQSPFRVGMKVRTIDYVYVRSEPRWAEETRLQQLQPGVEMEIIGGPVCAPYKNGVYVYWKVRLPSGDEVWIAEGDPQGMYIEAIR